MAKKYIGKTAAEFLAELEGDQEYQSRMRERERKRKELEELLSKDEASLVEALNRNGFEVESVWDLVNTKATYAGAIPILVEHLGAEHHPRTKEGIVRALTVKEARGLATSALIDEYKKSDDEDPSGFKWVVANALTVAADESSVPDIVELVKDSQHSTSREMLVEALANLKSAGAKSGLEELSKDRDKKVTKKAKAAFKKL